MARRHDDVNITPAIGLYCTPGAEDKDAEFLFEKYGFPRLHQAPTQGYALVWDDHTLRLHAYGKHAPGPVAVDWEDAKARRRLLTSGRQQPLARACGFKPNINPRVLDATAGLGQDGFVLAWLGARVHGIERSPVACALLEDGLRRARQQPALAVAAARMTLEWADALERMTQISEDERPDTVYLDPMYPHTGRTALSGKNMQAFQACIGEDLDADALLQYALAVARQRVVVKRPKKAPFMAKAEPFTQIVGESTRYDIYMTHDRNGQTVRD